MKSILTFLALLTLAFTPSIRATVLLYDNTTVDSGDTVLYSTGPFVALGDQIHLVSAGTATQAKVELFNIGDAGTFDAELDFFDVGSPIGFSIGSFQLMGNSSLGMDVIDLTFDLGAGIPLPQDVVFTVSVSNQSTVTMDLGVDMFLGPTFAGASDETFMIAETGGSMFSQIATNNENVYFQLSGVAGVPETSSVVLLGSGLLVMGIAIRLRRQHGS